MIMGLEDIYGRCGDFKISLIYKNGPIIINTRSNITCILYFCKTIVKDYYT